jgi:hypothetical protein
VDQSSNATSIEQVEAVTMEPILIYKVTNKANSKVYIGQTVKSLKRQPKIQSTLQERYPQVRPRELSRGSHRHCELPSNG